MNEEMLASYFGSKGFSLLITLCGDRVVDLMFDVGTDWPVTWETYRALCLL